jgi:serine/threonine protein kinase
MNPTRFPGHIPMSPPEDDDQTVIRPSAGKAPVSGPYGPAEQDEADNALPIGSKIAEFEVKGLIGTGGFGIVYRAHDHSLGRDVALKEYLPTSLAARKDGQTVSVKAARHADTFAAGMASFINEARILAHFDNPSLVKVYRFWRANGTAYMVMPYYEGPTLKQVIQEASHVPTEEWLTSLLIPLMSALQLLHGENYFHRDIAPDNILLVKGKGPVLLDFGAARRVIGDKARAITVILKPGYAPVEQYSENPDMTQGAWTDIYALAAVMHHAITGKPPMPSVSRLMKDTATPLAQAAAGRYSNRFLRALDQALSVRPEHRPQSIAEFRSLLGLHDLPMPDATSQRNQDRRGPALDRKAAVGGGVLAVAAVAVAAFMLTGQEKPAFSPARSDRAQTPTQPPAPAQQAASPAPLEQQVPANEPAPQAPAPVPARPFEPADALAQLYELRDRAHGVAVDLDRTTVRIGKDKLRFQVQPDKAGYLYILMLGTDRQHISLLFPNGLDQKNQVKAGQAINLPRPGWAMTAGGPAGTNEFIAMVSERPRDFTRIGLKKVGPFSEFTLANVDTLMHSGSGSAPVLAGTPVCAAGTDCPSGYGAARFSIEEIN